MPKCNFCQAKAVELIVNVSAPSLLTRPVCDECAGLHLWGYRGGGWWRAGSDIKRMVGFPTA